MKPGGTGLRQGKRWGRRENPSGGVEAAWRWRRSGFGVTIFALPPPEEESMWLRIIHMDDRSLERDYRSEAGEKVRNGGRSPLSLLRVTLCMRGIERMTSQT